MDRIMLINQVVRTYFSINASVKIIPAKDLMPQFIEASIFEKDEKNGLPIRKILRKLDAQNQLHQIPYVFADRKLKNTNWYFKTAKNVVDTPRLTKPAIVVKASIAITRATKQRDEEYVLDLCDEVLNLKGNRQHKFDFLLGDTGRKLPVDIYYAELNLVIEYREYQHSNAVKHFDKPDKMTKSGVHRGEQRKIYDQRRRNVLPVHEVKLIEIDYTDFIYDTENRIVRDRARDLELVKGIVKIKKLN